MSAQVRNLEMQSNVRYQLERENLRVRGVGLEDEQSLGPWDLVTVVNGAKTYIHLRDVDSGQMQVNAARAFCDKLDERGFKNDYTKFAIVSPSGFSENAKALLWGEEGDMEVQLYLYHNNLAWPMDRPVAPPPTPPEDDAVKPPPDEPSGPSPDKPLYIGLYAAKGGVGKSTLSAHIAARLTYMGYKVALVDLDHQGNLWRLLGNGVSVLDYRNKPSELKVFSTAEFDFNEESQYEVVVCDCNPAIGSNHKQFLRKLDHVFIPLTLTPLGINRNAKVLRQSLEEMNIEKVDAKGYHVLINQYELTDNATQKSRNEFLNNLLKESLKPLQADYPKLRYLDPEEDGLYIRRSQSLLYWGLESLKSGIGTHFDFAKKNLANRDFQVLVDQIEALSGLNRKNEPKE